MHEQRRHTRVCRGLYGAVDDVAQHRGADAPLLVVLVDRQAALRFAPTPLRCSLWDRAANSLRSLRSLRSNRRGEPDYGCALRAPIPETALLTAPEIAPCG